MKLEGSHHPSLGCHKLVRHSAASQLQAAPQLSHHLAHALALPAAAINFLGASATGAQKSPEGEELGTMNNVGENKKCREEKSQANFHPFTLLCAVGRDRNSFQPKITMLHSTSVTQLHGPN